MNDRKSVPIEIRSLDRESPHWAEVGKLLLQMYDHMEEFGLMIPLAEDGQVKWTESQKTSVGRFSVVKVALEDQKVIGFASGGIGLTPAFLGSVRVGRMTACAVDPNHRGKGLGKKLMKSVEQWLVEQGVHSCEAQVLCQHTVSVGFCKSLGYETELYQMRKVSPKA